MTARPTARSLASAAALAAKDWLIEPAAPREPDEPGEPARLRAVATPSRPVEGWLPPSAGGPGIVARGEQPPPDHPRMSHQRQPRHVLQPQPVAATIVHEPLPRLPETPLAGTAPPAPLAESALPLAGRGVVAVIGLGRRCGTTVVARALACELAGRDGAGASAVTADAASGGMALGLPPAGRLARLLAPAGVGRLRACGRLCLVETADRPALAGATLYLAPLVLDDCDPRSAPVTAAIADHLVLVGGRGVEPALGTALAASLAPHAAGRPLIVANRVSDPDDPWVERADALFPDSRLGAALAVAGQDPRGALGRAVSDLVDRLDTVSASP